MAISACAGSHRCFRAGRQLDAHLVGLVEESAHRWVGFVKGRLRAREREREGKREFRWTCTPRSTPPSPPSPLSPYRLPSSCLHVKIFLCVVTPCGSRRNHKGLSTRIVFFLHFCKFECKYCRVTHMEGVVKCDCVASESLIWEAGRATARAIYTVPRVKACARERKIAPTVHTSYKYGRARTVFPTAAPTVET